MKKHLHQQGQNRTVLWIMPFIGYIWLIVATIIAYYPSLHYPFQFDDLANITKHFNIRHYNLKQLFFSGTRWISYWLNSMYYNIAMFDPYVYRLGNLGIHLLNGLLLFTVAQFILQRSSIRFIKLNYFSISLITTILFLLHPVQTQTVSYVIQGQLEGLATLSILIMIYLFLQFATHTDTIRWLFCVLLFLSGILSCGTKEITIVTPMLIAMVDWFFIASGRWSSFKSRIAIHSSLFFLITGLYLYFLKPQFFLSILGLTYYVKNNIGNVITHNPADKISPLLFLISQFKVILHYLFIFLWPRSISVEYDWMVVRSFFAPDCLLPLGALGLLALGTAYVWSKHKTHPIVFGALWFAICIAPRSSIMPSPELLVDYKTYLASIGWLLVIAILFVYLVDYVIHVTAVSLPIAKHLVMKLIGTQAFALLLIIATMQRNTVWRSGLEFWGSMIDHSPTSAFGKARAFNNYGVELSQNFGKFAESIPYYQKAISMDSNYVDPCNNLAVSYGQLGDIDNAIAALGKALKINPTYPEGYNNLASFLMQKNDFDQAKIALSHAIQLRPYYGKALFNLGRIHMIKHNDTATAWQYIKKACMHGDFDTDLCFAHYGKLSLMLEKYDDARTAYTKLLQLDQNNLEGYLGLAATHLALKEYDQAIDRYHYITERFPDNKQAWQGVGECYFIKNKIEKALDCFLKSRKEPLVNAGYVFSRLAACYEKLGQPANAYKVLTELLHYDIDTNLMSQVQKLCVNLKEQYHLS